MTDPVNGSALGRRMSAVAAEGEGQGGAHLSHAFPREMGQPASESCLADGHDVVKNWIDGTDSRTGLSQVSFPSSTRSPAATAVKSFEFDAIW